MNDNCNPNNCPLEPRVEALEKSNEQHAKTHREMYDRLRELETKSAVHEEKLDTIIEKLDALTRKVDALEAKPGQRWEAIVEKAVWAVCAAVIAFLLARIGL